MKNKGFTLVELVVTVAILLALSTIAVISVTGVLKDSNNDIDTIQEELLESAVKSYYLEHGIEDGVVTITELINDGLIDEDDREKFPDDLSYKITVIDAEKGKIKIERQ